METAIGTKLLYGFATRVPLLNGLLKGPTMGSLQLFLAGAWLGHKGGCTYRLGFF